MKKKPSHPNCNQPIRVMTTTPAKSGKGGVTGLWRNLEGHMERDGVSLSYLEIGSKSGGSAHPLTDQLRFRAELRRRSPDLVNVNPSLGLKSFIRDGLFIWHCAQAGIPAVVFFHGWNKQFEAHVERRWRWFFKATYGRADSFIVLAADFKRKLEEWGISRPVIIETTAVDEDMLAGFNLETKLRKMEGSSETRLLFLGSVRREKGIFELLETMSLLVRQGLPVRLTVAGDGPHLEEAVERVQHLGLGDNVEFLGYVRDESKVKAFESADVFVLLSYSEGMPVSVLEAFSFGLPVVTSAVGGLPDFFQDGEMGRITESRDPNVLAQLVNDLITDRGHLVNIAKHNYRYASEKFYASQVAARLRGIYRSALSASARQFESSGEKSVDSGGSEEFLKFVCDEANFLDGFFTRNDFDGYAINSLPQNSILLGAAKRSRILGVAIRQAFRLSPVNFRPLLGPRDKTRNPQTMVTLARAYLKLSCEPDDDAYVKALRLLDWIEQNRSQRFANFCLPQMKPLFVSSYTASRDDIAPLHTCYAGKLFLEHYERTGSERYLELARSAAGYFVENHPWEESPLGVYFQYVPGMEKKIYNSSAEISAFLVQVAEATGETSLGDVGMAGLSYISSVQNQDGSWFYGDTKAARYIDNFHTAYVLQAMFDALKVQKNPTLQNSFDMGLSYYSDNLFVPLSGGGLRPRHFDPRYLPRNSNLFQKVDLRDVANAMILFSSLSEVTNRFDSRIQELAHWTASHMRSGQGYCPEITWLWRNGIGYFDVVSWYFLALTHCARNIQIGQ